MRTQIAIGRADGKASQLVNVNWILTTVCNYSCSYCPSSLHDGGRTGPDIEVGIAFSKRVLDHYGQRGRDVRFVFAGGEPTAYKHLPRLAACVKAAGGRVTLISNGSRPVEWWAALIPFLDSVVLTHHIEYVNIDRFLAVIATLAAAVRVHVNITMLPNRFADCEANADRIAAANDGVTITFKPLLVGFGAQMYAYSEMQKQVLDESVVGRPAADSPEKRTLKVLYSDGAEEEMTGSQLIVREMNRWAGWHCNIGVESLAVDQHGKVFLANCKQGGQVGTIDDPQLRLPLAGITCGKSVCHCLSDIGVSRRRFTSAGEG